MASGRDDLWQGSSEGPAASFRASLLLDMLGLALLGLALLGSVPPAGHTSPPWSCAWLRAGEAAGAASGLTLQVPMTALAEGRAQDSLAGAGKGAEAASLSVRPM